MGRSKALLSRILCCFEAREIQNASHPLLFCRPIAESVWQCSAFKKSALSEPIQFLLRPKSTRQDSNKRGCVFPFPFPVWSWFCWYALLIWENRRQDSILATIYKQDRFSVSCLVLSSITGKHFFFLFLTAISSVNHANCKYIYENADMNLLWKYSIHWHQYS